MSKLLAMSVNLDKVTESRLFHGKRGKYLNIMVHLKDEPDNYGNDVICWEKQSKEGRGDKEKRNYLGSGRVIWSDDGEPIPMPTNKEGDIPF